MSDDIRICKNCKYFRVREGFGRCYFYPPKLVVSQNTKSERMSLKSKRPQTEHDDFCHYFKLSHPTDQR